MHGRLVFPVKVQLLDRNGTFDHGPATASIPTFLKEKKGVILPGCTRFSSTLISFMLNQ